MPLNSLRRTQRYGAHSLGIFLAALAILGCDPIINNSEGDPSAQNPITSTPVVRTDLVISPASVTLTTQSAATFTATGGSNTYTFELIAGVGSISASGEYLSGAAAGTAVIRVTDSEGTSALASALVYAPLQLNPIAQTVLMSGTISFSGSHGVTPYSYSISSGEGTIDPHSGFFTAPASTGTTIVRITDSIGNTSDSSVTINPSLSITPTSAELAVNNNSVFAPSGGIPPYSFSVSSGSGSVGATSGIYAAPAAAGNANVTLSDSAGNTAVASITIRPALSVGPGVVTLAVNNETPFLASGGVSPYVYSVAFGGGSIDPGTGLYTAPATSGSAVVLATDSLGNTASASVTIKPALAISPTAAALGATGQTTFSATGGLAPYTFSVIGTGTIGATTGAYTAPGSFGTDTVRVTDSLGNTSNATVAISNALSISPANITVAINNQIAFSASGGVAPYTYAITGGGGSIVAETGQYTAPSIAGSATVQVTDAALGTSTATVTVNSALAITPTSVTLSVNNTASFGASGGVGARTFSIQSGGGVIDPVSGAFTAPATSGTTIVAVTDTFGNVRTSTVAVRSALSVTPSTKYLVINSTTVIEPSGGVPPFTYAITAGPGIIDAGTGAFTAPAASGQTTTIQVTDALLNTTLTTVISVKPVQIASTRSSSCARMDNGTVQCWGANDYGQLGNGTFQDSANPVQVPGVTNVTQLAGATTGAFICALITDGTIQCWGDNSTAQMGVGTSVGAQTQPVQVSGISTATAISVGSNFACALLADTTIQCWGYNSSGQLGDGTVTQRSLPVSGGGGISTVTSVAAGGSHVCVALADGTAKCWGSNGSGQLGNGTTSIAATTAPESVMGLSNITEVFAGSNFSCAIASGSLHCWGTNGYGQLGLGNVDSFTTPQDTGMIGITSLSVGYATACAIFNTPAVKCWGATSNGTIGDGTTASRSLPTAVSGLSTAISISANGSSSGAFACALQDTGEIQCWGWNLNGQLGNGAAYSVSKPVTALGLSLPATAVTTGGNHTCALLSDGTIQCWGSNGYGQLGDGTTTSSLAPVSVSGINNAIAIDAGYAHTCALLSDQTVQCWGYNAYGQVGDGSTISRNLPVPVSDISTASAISVGYHHACAKLNDATMTCWGANGQGQLGDNTVANRSVPILVQGLGSSITSFSAGKGLSDRHATCAVLDSGTAKCWGSNSYGQIGDGTQTNQSLPTDVLNLTGITQIMSGAQMACAVLDTGEVSCWGYNNSGQLGNGTAVTSYLPNTTVIGISNPTSLAMSSAHVCALFDGGTIRCWGSNGRGQIGAGTSGGSYSVPIPVSDSSNFAAIAAGFDRSCALTSTGTVKCWGSNFYGETGNGIYGGDRYFPVGVVFQ